MEVEVKIGNNADKFNISKYLDNNIMYEEQKRIINKIEKKATNIREQIDEHITQLQVLMRDSQDLSNDSENFEDTIVQIKTKFSKVMLEFLQQKSIYEKVLAESQSTIEKIKLQRELLSITENIITRLEQEVLDVKQDKQLINKIIDEENMNCKSYDSKF